MRYETSESNQSTWYLTTSQPARQASLAGVMRLYGLVNLVQQNYKQMKDELAQLNASKRDQRQH